MVCHFLTKTSDDFETMYAAMLGVHIRGEGHRSDSARSQAGPEVSAFPGPTQVPVLEKGGRMVGGQDPWSVSFRLA
jgi:hypothetical protein